MTEVTSDRRKRAKPAKTATTDVAKPPVAVESGPPAKPAAAPIAAKKAARIRPAAPVPAAAVATPAASEPVASKAKLVRDSFTIPKPEYDALTDLKRRALALNIAAKKSELIRAGIAALTVLDDAAFRAAVDAVPNLKTGRPKSSVG